MKNIARRLVFAATLMMMMTLFYSEKSNAINNPHNVPQSTMSIYDLAKIYYIQGQNYELQLNYNDAERYYGKAVAIEDTNSQYIEARLHILRLLGRNAELQGLKPHVK